MRDQAIILIVDDTPAGRDTLTALLMVEKYEILTAADGYEAIEKAEVYQPDLILLDVMMPGMDGFEVCRRLRADKLLSEVPIVLVTALDDRASKLQGLEAGADDFITKPIDRAELRARVRTIVRLNRFRKKLEERDRFERLVDLSPDGIITTSTEGVVQLANQAAAEILGVEKNTSLEGKNVLDFMSTSDASVSGEHFSKLLNEDGVNQRFESSFTQSNEKSVPVEIHAGLIRWGDQAQIQMIFHDITDQKMAEYRLKLAYTSLEDALEDTISGWARALELRDHETEGHSRRVTELTISIARKLNFDDIQLKHIRRGAMLHDIGKIGVPDQILLAPRKLTDEEWCIMRKHPEYGFQILSPILFLVPALPIPVYHHEKWNGSGYPQGLKGNDIPLEARIFAIVDVYDALSSNRPYHAAWPKDKVIEFIQSQVGIHFDPEVVKVFLEVIADQ
jgi:PAS domain S-box-containing protein